jgi:hypothetical protein
MSDQPPIPRPALSDDTISYQREIAAGLPPDHPYRALIDGSLGKALAATGQDKPPAPDPRTPAQALHDRNYSVRPGSLPTHLSQLIEPGEPDNAKAVLEGTGRVYADVVAAARAALIHGGSQADPAKLSAAALLALAAYSDHLTKWAAGRPKE